MFGVKESLIVDLSTVEDEALAAKYNVKKGTALLTYDFVLASKAEALNVREKKAREAVSKFATRMKIVQGLPVPDVD